MTVSYLLQKAVAPNGALAGRDPIEIMQALHGRGPVDQILDLRLRTGPYGDLFGARPEGLSLSRLEAHPHGIDLGALRPRIPNALRTRSGKIELVPSKIAADLGRLREALDESPPEMMLIGRRQLKSNNSWMHNVPTMLGGSNRCTMMVNPKDAERLGLVEGALAQISSRAGEIEAPVEVTDELMPGVVSIPHGWGHNVGGSRLSVASGDAGVSANDITDEQVVDPLSGNAVLNAVPVEVRPAISGGERAEPVTIGSAEPT
jgi:anaerobic selenocysteine-containing dehydrogenase